MTIRVEEPGAGRLLRLEKEGLQVEDARVEEVMTRLFVALKPTDSIRYAAQRLARNHIIGAPVIERGKVVGIISESDIVRAAFRPERGMVTNFLDAVANARQVDTSKSLRTTRVGDAMSTPVITASPEMTVSEAAALTHGHGLKRLPVIDQDWYLIGVISRADIVRSIGTERTDLRRGALIRRPRSISVG